MNSNGPLTISQMAGRFGSRSFSPEMRTAAGGNESGLKKFLLKYPSLFTVRGNMVSLYDGKGGDEEVTRESSPASSASGSIALRNLPDVSMEMEAVQYFQHKLMKKEEKWVQIKSLAGHISQASANVRSVVGPQLEFRKWLLKHPHIFEVQGELVGLRDGIAAVSTPTIPHRHSGVFDYSNGAVTNVQSQTNPKVVPPKTPPATRKAPPKTPPTIRRSHSFSEKKTLMQQAGNAPVQARKQTRFETSLDLASQPVGQARKQVTAPVTMTANEYKAVIFMKEVLEQHGPVKVVNFASHLNTASEAVRSAIGRTKADLEEFLFKNASMFSVTDDDMVILNSKAQKMNVLITGSKAPPQSNAPAGTRTLNGRKGKIFHVAKLWGIVDLGKHEHVFFDKSIMKKPIDDLQKEFKVGETLFFNAVLAPKTSRAKWKATHVWKENEQEPSDNDSELSSSESREVAPSPSGVIEDEINQFLPNNDQATLHDKTSKFVDAAPSGAGVVPIWNFEGAGEGSTHLSMVPESYQMSASALSDLSNKAASPKPTENYESKSGDSKVRIADASGTTASKKMVTIACQTIATGDIIATQLYQES